LETGLNWNHILVEKETTPPLMLNGYQVVEGKKRIKSPMIRMVTPRVIKTDLCLSENTHGYPSDITSRTRHHWVSFGVLFFAA